MAWSRGMLPDLVLSAPERAALAALTRQRAAEARLTEQDTRGWFSDRAWYLFSSTKPIGPPL